MVLLVLSGCAAPSAGVDAGGETTPIPPGQPAEQQAIQPVDVQDGKDWLRLKSGEWLRGEIKYLDRKTMAFDSEELDDLQLDWEDVDEVHTTRLFTVLFDDGSKGIGSLRLRGGQAVIETGKGPMVVERRRLFRMVPGEPKETNYWSGKVSAGATVRTGNTRRFDYDLHLALTRRTADSRLPLYFDTIYSETDSTSTADNTRLGGQYDRFLTPRLYVTPLGVEFMRDPFQNTDLRATPFVGLGYTLIDDARLEWGGEVGLGYRYTRFDSVPTGASLTDEQTAGILGTTLSWDVNAAVELNLDYSVQLALGSIEDTIQSASLSCEVDLWRDLDLDVRLRWDRVGNPQPDSAGVTPKPDDFSLTLGLGWEF